MSIKNEFKLETFVKICWGDSNWGISIIWNFNTLVDNSVVKIWILAQPYKSTIDL